MSDREESQSEQSDQEPANFLEALKGDNPKIFGYDYYNVIYGAAIALASTMGYLYLVMEDKELKRMVLVQGALAIGLLMTSMYYRKRME